MLLVSEPVLGADEKAALAAVIDSGWVTMGDRVAAGESGLVDQSQSIRRQVLLCVERPTQNRSHRLV
jgi:dTDP-4-amino-4,6-dideoxygalactose transaminase